MPAPTTKPQFYDSRYSIPRTLPYFNNYKQKEIIYRDHSDIGKDCIKLGIGQLQFFSGSKKHSGKNPNNCVQKIGNLITKSTGNITSISVNDLLDQHLSNLTLGGIRSTPNTRKKKKKSSMLVENKSDHLLDSGSDDSMLIRQAREIEKGNMLKKKELTKKSREASASKLKRAALEPSIVTLVHGTPPARPQTPRTPSSPAPPTPRFCNVDKNVFSPDLLAQQEALIPDCTTVESIFVRRPLNPYSKDRQAPLLCEKVRYGTTRPRLTTHSRVAQNPSKALVLSSYVLSSRRNKKRKPKGPMLDPMRSFGPWVVEGRERKDGNGGEGTVPDITTEFFG